MNCRVSWPPGVAFSTILLLIFSGVPPYSSCTPMPPAVPACPVLVRASTLVSVVSLFWVPARATLILASLSQVRPTSKLLSPTVVPIAVNLMSRTSPSGTLMLVLLREQATEVMLLPPVAVRLVAVQGASAAGVTLTLAQVPVVK
ncbi:hypothetical protein D3C71_1355150 [compost metagenome]